MRWAPCLAVVLGLAVPAGAGTLNFHDVSASSVVQAVAEIASNEKAVDSGDFDHDGDLDVVIANAYSDFGARRNKLYRNDGGVFVEISGAPAIPGFSTADVTRVAFLRDYTGDGWLDIAVINDNNSAQSKLYLNQTADGRFDHFELVGTSHFPGPGGAADSGVSFDLDGAGGVDLLISSGPNSPQNRLWLNDGTGYFLDVTATQMPPDADYTVDAAAGDLNGDGKLDVLLSNHGLASNRIYYNDLPGTDSTGPGDFLYAPSGAHDLGNPAADENSMEAGDFDGDGRQDVYWSNGLGATGDVILHNTGNDPAGKAVFVMLPAATLPASVNAVASRKVTVADLNGDGRPDVFVTKEAQVNSRPTVLRNTSVNGVISFVDWTPGIAFPNGNAHKGWHAAVFDADGDGDADIFLGGWSNDHLFANVPPLAFTEAGLDGQTLPPLFGREAVAVTGQAAVPEVDAYHTVDVETGFLSVILSGPDDYKLELQTVNHVVIGVSDRGGPGVEEALQVNVTGPTKIVVALLGCGAAPGDLDGNCAVDTVDFLALLAAWGPQPGAGNPADLDGDGEVGVTDFLALLAAWGPISRDYLLEILARD